MTASISTQARLRRRSSAGHPSGHAAISDAVRRSELGDERAFSDGGQGHDRGNDDPVPDVNPTSADEVAQRLAALEGRLRDELGASATVQRSLIDDGRISVVDIAPANPRSLGVTWLEMQGELLLQAGQGGRWELDRSNADVAVIESITRSLIAGRAVETFAFRRCALDVVLEDGTVERSAVGEGCLSALLPLPGWRRLGHKVRHEPYQS
jgi:hypothetical protein